MNDDPNILIWRAKDEIRIVNVYVDDFLSASNTIATLKALKVSLAQEYDINDLKEVKTIIGWQIHQDLAAGIMKIDQSAFVQDLVIEEGLTDCNVNVIPMKAGLFIKRIDSEDYEEANLCIYQQFIDKLIYLAYDTRQDIVFVIRQPSKYNVNLRQRYL